MKPVYLDYNATTPLDPAVREAMLPFLGEQFGNPSSSHRLGHDAHNAVEAARCRVAELMGAKPDEIVFTSGGTESSNLAIQGLLLRKAPEGRGHLVISAIEHPATVEPALWLQRRGFALTVVNCDSNGVVSPGDVAAAVREDTLLVSVMHANNEVGTVQPISAIAEICRGADVVLHVDAAQSLGKIPVDVTKLGADLLTVAGHKLYAPKGIGALYVRAGIELEPVIRGAGQERGLRPGTENVAQIVGLGVASRLAMQHLPDVQEQLAAKRDRLASLLREAVGSQLTVHAENAERLPNTLSVSFPNVVGSELLAQVPELCASTGAACHSGTTRVSATLAAMGVSEDTARGTVRLSVGKFSTDEEIGVAAQRLGEAWRRLK